MTNREMLESALKRVNALAETKGKLYKENNFYFVAWFTIFGGKRFDESKMTAGELLAYLHGLEDALLYINNKEDKQ
jgi:hypothetical protein